MSVELETLFSAINSDEDPGEEKREETRSLKQVCGSIRNLQQIKRNLILTTMCKYGQRNH